MLRMALLLIVVVIVAIVILRSFSGGRAAAIAPGSAAPEFTLPSQEGASVSLKDYRGSWVVLYFYPKDLTPGCTREAREVCRTPRDCSRRGRGQCGIAQKVLCQGRTEFQTLSRYRRQGE